jgi:hypothetical protein
VGRSKAQQFLQDPLLSGAGQLGPLRYQPQAINPIDPKLGGLKLEQMPKAVRERVRDRLRERTITILEQLGLQGSSVAPGVRDAVDKWLVTPNLNKYFKL